MHTCLYAGQTPEDPCTVMDHLLAYLHAAPELTGEQNAILRVNNEKIHV